MYKPVRSHILEGLTQHVPLAFSIVTVTTEITLRTTLNNEGKFEVIVSESSAHCSWLHFLKHFVFFNYVYICLCIGVGTFACECSAY